MDKRHLSVAERKARFRHLQQHCPPEPSAASTRDSCPTLERRAAKNNRGSVHSLNYSVVSAVAETRVAIRVKAG